MEDRQYSGLYTRPNGSRRPKPRNQENRSLYNHFLSLVKIMPSFAFNGIGFNYVAVFTIVSIVILSYLLPDLSQKLLLKNEVKTVEKVLDLMTKEVNRAETACLTVAEEFRCLHCAAAVCDNATETVSVRNKRDLAVCPTGGLTGEDKQKVRVCAVVQPQNQEERSQRHVDRQRQEDAKQNEGCSPALVNFLRSSNSEPAIHNMRPAPSNHRCLGNRKTSYHEIALMSFVYTDSFDDTRSALM